MIYLRTHLFFYSRRRHAGFVLVATLWILAMLTVAVGFFAQWTQRVVENVIQVQHDIGADKDLYSTRQTLMYLALTRWYSVAGVTLPETDDKARWEQYTNEDMWGYGIVPVGTEIRLDDTVYQGLGTARFALQDEAGLLSLDAANPYTSPRIFERFFASLGIDPARRGPLLAKLADYEDVDDLTRLNGAESRHYKEAHELPPTNRALRTPLETMRILEWPKQLSLWPEGRWEDLTKPFGTVYVNINTAPASVIQAVYDWPPALVKKIMRVRPLSSAQALRELGIPLDGKTGPPQIFPSGNLRLTLWGKEASSMQRFHVRLNHIASRMPWRIEYAVHLPVRNEYRRASAALPKTGLFSTR